MLLHIPCKGCVVVLVDEMKFGADNFSLDTRNGIVRISSLIVLAPREMKKIPIKFYCQYCEKYIDDLKEVGVMCGYCGKPSPIEDHFVVKNGGSTSCKHCKKKYIAKGDIEEKYYMSFMDMFTNGIIPPERNN